VIRHAGRTTITTEDVLLLTRRNEALAELLKAHMNKVRDTVASGKKKQKT